MDISVMTNLPIEVISVSFPLYVEVRDYHEFKFLTNILGEVTGRKDITHVELGCDGKYHGIVFLTSQAQDKTLLDEIARIKKTFEG